MAYALLSSAHGICSPIHKQIGLKEPTPIFPQKCSTVMCDDGQRFRAGLILPGKVESSPSPSRNKAERGQQRRSVLCRAKTYTVEIMHGESRHVLQVPEDETILTIALEENLDVPHDCKLGVCMTCPAKLEKGAVDQSGGMLSDDVIERGYALMCASYPLSDCVIRTIPEEELLSLQLATANDA